MASSEFADCKKLTKLHFNLRKSRWIHKIPNQQTKNQTRQTTRVSGFCFVITCYPNIQRHLSHLFDDVLMAHHIFGEC